MELVGSIEVNLVHAITSATRLRGKKVHADTLAYWRELIAMGRKTYRLTPSVYLANQVAKLETLLAEREEVRLP